MIGNTRATALLGTSGVLIYIGVTFVLTGAQPDYDPIQQFMSELALGRRGGFMVVAFVGLATAVAATAAHLRAQAAPKLLTHTLALAAASLVGAIVGELPVMVAEIVTRSQGAGSSTRILFETVARPLRGFPGKSAFRF